MRALRVEVIGGNLTLCCRQINYGKREVFSYYSSTLWVTLATIASAYTFKTLSLASKAIHGLAPAYISDLLVIKRKSSYNIKSKSGILLEPPRSKMLATLVERAFQATAPHLWDELPLQLRTIRSVENFKNSIKTFLFKQTFQ